MKILVIGSGGREHAIIWKLKKHNKDLDIYCAPGNGGIGTICKNIPIGVMEFEKIASFCLENKIDFVIIGPDDPLVAGVVDYLEEKGIKVFGPNKKAAQIEGSKSFSKNFMKKYEIPTAQYEIFDDFDKAMGFLETSNFPIVIKADGLALGKGVIIANNKKEAEEALISIMKEKKFGSSGDKVVIEEFLVGQEVSILAFCDGKTIVPMVSAQDHKRAYDNDEGLNTGGMGTFSPSRYYTKDTEKECMEKIFIPTVEGLNKEGITFKGIIFFGLMITENGVKVVEYNARFGDPETQVVLPRLKNDLIPIFEACINGNLADINIEWEDKGACCVILASGGYPEKYETGFVINGATDEEDIYIFHSGTKFDGENFYTSGGRVLGVTALSDNLEKAVERAYDKVQRVSFKNMHFRKDIGNK